MRESYIKTGDTKDTLSNPSSPQGKRWSLAAPHTKPAQHSLGVCDMAHMPGLYGEAH